MYFSLWGQPQWAAQLLAGQVGARGPRQLPGRGGWFCCAGLLLHGAKASCVCREMSLSDSVGAIGAVVLGAEGDPSEHKAL